MADNSQTKYELSWCMAYLASSVTIFGLNRRETEQVLKVPIDEVRAFSNERKLRDFSEDQTARILCATRIFAAAEHSRGAIDVGWFTSPNPNRLFGGQRPIDRMSTNHLNELEAICGHVRYLAGF